MKKFLTRLWAFKQQKQKENDIPETKQIWKKNQLFVRYFRESKLMYWKLIFSLWSKTWQCNPNI